MNHDYSPPPAYTHTAPKAVPAPLRIVKTTAISRPEQPLRLLSLDGGGVRGFSQILLVQELMLKLFYELEGRAPRVNEIPKPCDHFDLIGGTGTGGLIAILLGRCRLDLEACKEIYIRVTKHVFETDKTIAGLPYKSTLFKASKLEEAIKDVLTHLDIDGSGLTSSADEDANDQDTISNFLPPQSPPPSSFPISPRRQHSSSSSGPLSPSSSFGSSSHQVPPTHGSSLLYDPRPNRCRTFVTAVYRGSSEHHPPAFLRTYDSAQSTSPSPRCAIWEAGRATSAHSPAFKPIQIGQDIFLDEGPGRYSPVAQVLEEALIHEFPGRQVGVLVSIGSGKKPSAAPNTTHSRTGATHPEVPGPQKARKNSVLRTFTGGYSDAREKHQQKLADCESIHQELLSGLHRTGVARENYFRLNVEVGVGDYGINEWSRLAEISTSTRRYLATAEVQEEAMDCAVQMANILRRSKEPTSLPMSSRGFPSEFEAEQDIGLAIPSPLHTPQRTPRTMGNHSEGGVDMEILNRQLPDLPRETHMNPLEEIDQRDQDGQSEVSSLSERSDGAIDDDVELSDEEIERHLEQLERIRNKIGTSPAQSPAWQVEEARF